MREARWGEVPQLEKGCAYRVIDIWTGTDLGYVEGGLKRVLESHDTAAFLEGKKCRTRSGWGAWLGCTVRNICTREFKRSYLQEQFFIFLEANCGSRYGIFVSHGPGYVRGVIRGQGKTTVARKIGIWSWLHKRKHIVIG